MCGTLKNICCRLINGSCKLPSHDLIQADLNGSRCSLAIGAALIAVVKVAKMTPQMQALRLMLLRIVKIFNSHDKISSAKILIKILKIKLFYL